MAALLRLWPAQWHLGLGVADLVVTAETKSHQPFL
jgi:hypothetical protein